METAEDTTSNMKGIQREKSQARFISLIIEPEKISSLNSLTNSHQLSMWLSMTSFDNFISSLFVPSPCAPPPDDSVHSEVDDIVYYIGGFVIHKLLKRSSCEENTSLLKKLVSEDPPDPNTLLDAKSYGGLTNISADAKILFLQLELLFRQSNYIIHFQASVKDYLKSVFEDDVVQNCFFMTTYSLDHPSQNLEFCLSEITKLYYKIRIHAKCKHLVEDVRNKKQISRKEKALRTKLS